MRTTTTPSRTSFLTAIAIAVPLSLVLVAGLRGADPGQDDESKSKKMKQTASGLEYRDLKEGTGDTPKAGQTCVVHYTGWLWDNNAKGKKFDSSVDRDKPFSFPVGMGRVIKGWDEGVASMKVGGKRELLIPAKLAYGSRGAGGVIPANATLFFEVELLSLVKQPSDATEVKKTASGLQFIDLKEGTGVTPRSGQTCVVHYTGWLWENNAKGKKFDSSVDRGEPFSFAVGAARSSRAGTRALPP